MKQVEFLQDYDHKPILPQPIEPMTKLQFSNQFKNLPHIKSSISIGEERNFISTEISILHIKSPEKELI